MPNFVLSDCYQKSLILLPKTIQRKTIKTVEKLCSSSALMKANQQDKGLHFEELKGYKNRKTRVYSARIDQGYRLILLRGPSKASPYYIYFAGKHDEADTWASRHDLVINPRTGGLQLLVCPEVIQEKFNPNGPLASIRQAHWQRLGLPSKFLSEVRNLKCLEDVQRLQGLVHPETLEAIQYLLVGCSLEEVLNTFSFPDFNWKENPGLFDGVSEDDLLDLGVPDTFLDRVYALSDEQELDALQLELPVEAYEGLFFLNCGFGVDEIIREYGRARGQVVDTNDYQKTLDNPDSKRNHVLLPKGEELARFLEDSLEGWRIFLHQTQRKIVESSQPGPVLVLGGAGTGKTVVAMHRAKWLAENVCRDGESILFTTFNVNLAQDINNNMNNLCCPESRNRIFIGSIDKWVWGFLKERGFHKVIEYWPNGTQLKYCFEKALKFVPFVKTFNRDELYWEWKNVFQPWNFKNAKEYLDFRGTWDDLPSVNQKNVLGLYEFFDTYRNYLKQREVVDFGGALLAAGEFARKEPPLFRSIVVDEAQDMRPGVWMLLKNLVKKGENDLFIVGDPAQRIGTAYAELSRCGIDVTGRTDHLHLNYRTTENIRSWAGSILEGRFIDDLDGGFESQKGYHSERKGDVPEVQGFRSINEEVNFIYEKIREFMAEQITLEDMVVIVHHEKNLLPVYQRLLEERGVPVCPLGKQEIDDRKREGIRMTIMHRVKGLEFENVFLAGISEDHVPPKWLREKKSEHELERFFSQERALLYVSATRAKNRLVVTWYGKPSSLLDNVLKKEGFHD